MPSRRKVTVKPPDQMRTVRGLEGGKTRVRIGGNKVDVRISPPKR